MLLSWAAHSLWSTPSTSEPPLAAEQQASVARKTAPALPDVHTLHEERGSAYHARLFAEGDGVVLATPDGFTILHADHPAEQHAVLLGPAVARHGDALAFWRSGSLREVSLSGADEHELVAVPRAPQYLLATADRLAWIHTHRETGTSLQTLSDGRARVIHDSPLAARAPVLRAASVYWVAEGREETWTIERIDLDGQHRTSSKAHRGRPPAILAAGEDGLYFYDNPQRGVRRSSFDLDQENAVRTGVVCSPIAISTRVVCAQVGGLFEIPPSDAAPRFLASERSGPITALAATTGSTWWVAENGDEKLVVRSVSMSRVAQHP